ncbi:hypothetical protein Pst134EA_023064 [Puccinia striiformis f. sp. tritici]|uniref:hypothetical protein n=1 Tax=Puccinia striiformis f. sp. tritici TaxID=168172 RepID=UPI0020076B3F|nr:hypothetical protein Pst134EA_023064 [Puccinia striiformis f. sp. tritici]KAH9455604.1 hypothetical protein Pst134EA_023064 [Puccinia striiformis f. sp. tritici]
MDAEWFDPRAPFVTKDILRLFLYQNEHTIYLRSSLSKTELIKLVDEQKQRSRLDRTTTTINVATPVLPSAAVGTRTSPCQRPTPSTAPVLNNSVADRNARLEGRPQTLNTPEINQQFASTLLGDPAASLDVPSSQSTDLIVLADVAGDTETQASKTLMFPIRNFQLAERSILRTCKVPKHTSHLLLADANTHIRAPDNHLAVSSTGFESPSAFPAFLYETQQLPGAFPIDLLESSATYPLIKLSTDVHVPQIQHVVKGITAIPFPHPGQFIAIHFTILYKTHISFPSEVMNSASRIFAEFVDKTLLKLHQFSIANTTRS